MKKAKAIALLGTGSDVGKSVLATALCRCLADRGYKVAPFKAQNMSNNSFVTKEGGEMGRAQVVQALACRLEPSVLMNPILLKPSSDIKSQVILLGQPWGDQRARDYYLHKKELAQKAYQAMAQLQAEHDVLVIEGAGSCAEMNLKAHDIVNFATAHQAKAEVILVADIDRGGVFAQVVGTLALIPPEDRALVKGVLINRFRGDLSLFDEGVRYLEEKTGVPVLGVVPYFQHISIEAEDGVVLEQQSQTQKKDQEIKVRVGVLRLPHISNFTDFLVLEQDPQVQLDYLRSAKSLQAYDLVILPGSKNVRSDLAWLAAQGWQEELLAYHAQGGKLMGICGGYQMLGQRIMDPLGVEGPPGEALGLGLLEVETTMEKSKTLSQSQGVLLDSGLAISGYEIHMGQTRLGPGATPLLRQADGRLEGAQSPNGQVWGSYFHGILDAPAYRQALLCSLNPSYQSSRSQFDLEQFRDQQIQLLAEEFAKHVKLEQILSWLKSE